jgi:hypothetical protein
LPTVDRGVGVRFATTTTSSSEVSVMSAAGCAAACVAKRMRGMAAGSRTIRCFTAELPSRVYPGGSRGRVQVESAVASATWHHVLPRGPCRHSVDSARAAHPGCSIGRPRQAGLLACGSDRASPSRTLVQWPLMRGIPRTVAGAARAFTRVPVLIPFAGNLSRAGKVPEPSGRVNWGAGSGSRCRMSRRSEVTR